MIESKDIDALMGADVVDDDDDRIGKVSQVYVDSHDQHPSWVAVKTGFFGSAETLVPIEDASWDTARLHVGVSKDKVKDAPHVDPDREITVDEQNQLYRHYGIAASVDHDQRAEDRAEDRAGDRGDADEGSQGRHAAAQDDRDRGAADRAERTDGESRDGDVQRDAEAGTVVSDAGSYSVEDATPTADATPDDAVTATSADSSTAPSAAPTDQVDRDSAGVSAPVAGGRDDRAASGPAGAGAPLDAAAPGEPASAGVGYRMRLRKVSVTEQRTVTVTVPVTHEEVRLERVPDDEPDGPDVIDGEADVVLMAERPVVTTEQVAAEHVHVAVDRIDGGGDDRSAPTAG